jgi:hypothetical protein
LPDFGAIDVEIGNSRFRLALGTFARGVRSVSQIEGGVAMHHHGQKQWSMRDKPVHLG